MQKKFIFLTLKMDYFARKLTAHNASFSVWGVKDLCTYPLIKRGKAKKVAVSIKGFCMKVGSF